MMKYFGAVLGFAFAAVAVNAQEPPTKPVWPEAFHVPVSCHFFVNC